MNKHQMSLSEERVGNHFDDTLCVLPWIGRELRADGTLAVCCTSDYFFQNADGSPLSLLNLSDNAELEKNPSLLEFQSNFLRQQKSKACDRCWHEEASGAKSRRQKMNLRHPSEFERIKSDPKSSSPVVVLDIKVGNVCNQKCLICGPGASSLWIAEHKALLGPTTTRITKNISADSLPILQKILKQSTELHIAGGEPFLDEGELVRLLEPSVRSGQSKLQTIIIPTNGSFFPERLVNEIFPHFKEVQILLSADGVEAQFEYTRFPGKWNTFYENYLKFKGTPFFAGISITLNALNAYNLGDYLYFWEQKNESRVWVGYLNAPEYLSVASLPRHVRDQISRKWLNIKYKTPQMAALIMELYQYLQQFSEAGADQNFTFLTRSIDKHDSYRKITFAEFFPEYSLLLRKSTFE